MLDGKIHSESKGSLHPYQNAALNHMKTIFGLAIIVLVSCLLISCSSTGVGELDSSQIPHSAKTVFLRPNTDERAAEYMPEVTAKLRAAGFSVTSTNSAPYDVAVVWAGGGFDLTCSIVMYEHGVPIVSGKGVNPGWGVWLARDKAYRGVFKMALKQFSKRIQSM